MGASHLLRTISQGRSIFQSGSRSLPINTLLQHRTLATLVDDRLYWQKIPAFATATEEEFISYRFQLRHTVNTATIQRFLHQTLPETLVPSSNARLRHIRTKDDFVRDVLGGLAKAPMAVRMTPHVLSTIDWTNPLDDPIRRQFIPLASDMLEDHKALTTDSLGEQNDSPVPGLVHRYPGRALFLATSICPVYCRFCTRAYAVGANTQTITKVPQKPSRKRWELVFQYIEQTPELEDIVVSGGDAYYLAPEDITEIGERLLKIPHIRRFRIASKGLSVAPGRILDTSDPWAKALVDLSNLGRDLGKQVCWHTHINHPNEISWVTEAAARFLFKHGVIVRNQSVLLKGINDDEVTMETLLKKLSHMNIQPYYVYQCDLVRGIEDLRTPLSTLKRLDKYLRGRLSGFMMPSFVVDLPGGGGKRLVSTHDDYNEETGVSTWSAPGLKGAKATMKYQYFDPHYTQDQVQAEVSKDQQYDTSVAQSAMATLEDDAVQITSRPHLGREIYAPPSAGSIPTIGLNKPRIIDPNAGLVRDTPAQAGASA